MAVFRKPFFTLLYPYLILFWGDCKKTKVWPQGQIMITIKIHYFTKNVKPNNIFTFKINTRRKSIWYYLIWRAPHKHWPTAQLTWEGEEQRGREKEEVQIAGAEIAYIPEGTELACPRPPAAHSDVCFGISPWIWWAAGEPVMLHTYEEGYHLKKTSMFPIKWCIPQTWHRL